MTSMMLEQALPDDEAQQAATWWAGQAVRRPWVREAERHRRMADRVLSHDPVSVLEFGCAAGRNLHAIRDRAPGVRLVGVDINERAMRHGRLHWDLDLRGVPLSSFDDDEFDVAFTVSVLDHIPDPGDVLDELVRVAPVLLLLEPWLGWGGKVDAGVVTGTSPYSYSHDLAPMLRERGCRVRFERHPLSDWGLGPYYRLYTVRQPDRPTPAPDPVSDPVSGPEAASE